MLISLLALPAFAAFNYGVAIGGAGSFSPCSPAPYSVRGSPSGTAFVGARWERSEWFVGLSTAWGLEHVCGHHMYAHYLLLQSGYLAEVGALRLGGYASFGTSWYLGAGFQIEKPIVAGPVEIAPGVRLSYNWPLTVESHLLVRVTPSSTRRATGRVAP